MKKLCVSFAAVLVVAAVFTGGGAAADDPAAKLTASDGTADDYFGGSVGLSDSGTLLVGAPADDESGINSGSAYVYAPGDAGGYVETKLTASDGAAFDQFGTSIAVSSSGTMVVGAHGDGFGSAYVFVPDGVGDYAETKLTASDAASGDQFGFSVAVSDSGTVVVGADQDDDNGSSSGSAYVFVPDGAGGYAETKLTASDAAEFAGFGRSVAVSDSGTVVVGAFADQENGINSGSAYVFVPDGAGGYAETKLTASDASRFDWFGFSVAVADSGTVVVGAFGNRDNGLSSGSAYVFVPDGAGGYAETKLTASDAAEGDEFGVSVAVSDSGTVVVGAPRFSDEDGSQPGSAYVFVPDGAGGYVETKLTGSFGASNDLFGVSVAVSDSQSVVVVGAGFDSENSSKSGAVYVFDTPTESVSGSMGPADDQVLRLYRAVFDRAPDAGGFEFWTSQYQGGRSLTSIVDAFIASPEFIARYGASPTDAELVDALYRNVLGRPGDPGGVDFWLDRLANGATTNELLRSFADSPENIAATNTSEPLSSVESKVLRLYRAVYGRAPDAGGFAFWVDQVANGRSMLSIAAAFEAAPEFSDRYGAEPSDQELIAALYRNVLDRAGDTGGVDFWLGERAGGMTVPELLLAFADSAENLKRTGTRP